MKTVQCAFVSVLLLIAAFGLPVFAQSYPQDAHIAGTITDASGRGVGGVRVTAQQDTAGNAQLWTATSATDGSYDLSLPPERYHVHFSRESFSPPEIDNRQSVALPIFFSIRPESCLAAPAQTAAPLLSFWTVATRTSQKCWLTGRRSIHREAPEGSITFTGTYRQFSAKFAGYFVGQATDSDFLGLGYTRNPGYARFDLAANYAFYRGFSVYARASNLFDKSYQLALGYPALGRDARIGLRYQFSGRN